MIIDVLCINFVVIFCFFILYVFVFCIGIGILNIECVVFLLVSNFVVILEDVIVIDIFI